MAIESTAIVVNGDEPGVDYRHYVLTVPAGKTYAITTILVCNKYSPSATSPENETESFDMFIVKDGDPVSVNETIVVRELSLPAGETFTFDSEKIVLEENDKIVIDGNAGSSDPGAGNLVVTVSYLEV